jgi:hypothetical protein
MAINTQEIELHAESLAKFAKDQPQALRWLLHNFDAIKTALDAGTSATDLSGLQAQITALQATVAALQAEVDAIPPSSSFDPSGLQAQIDNLQDQIDAIVIPVIPPPFVMPDGLDDQVLTHGPGGNGDIFFRDPAVFAPLQSGDLIPVNEGEADEAILPEFMLDPDGKIMLVQVQ